MKPEVEVKKSIEEVSQVQKRVKVEIPREIVEKKKEESFLKIQKKAKIQGFRPGKAPLSIIKTRYRDAVVEQLEEDLVKEGYFAAVKESEFKPVAIMEIMDGKYVEGEDFRFTALVEVLPDFEPAAYKGINITLTDQDVTDEEVNAEIGRMRERQAVYKPVERESGKDDLLEISFKASDGETVIEEQEDSTYLLSDTSTLGEDFEKNLIGKKAGDELDFEVSYPADFTIDQIKGKKVRYMIRVKAVKEKGLPEVNDDFARSLPEVESLDDLKNKIREYLGAHKEEEQKKLQREQIVDTLVDNNPIEVPQTLVDEEMNRVIRDTQGRLKAQGVQFDPSQMDIQKLREKYRDGAVKAVKASIILSEIAKIEGIEATDEDVNKELESMSKNYNISLEKVASYYKDERAKDSLKNVILDRKVMEFLLKSGASDAEKETRDTSAEEGKTKADE
jgi:trigger factor